MIIALDPSINNTGYAVGDNGKVIESGVIKTGGSKISVAERLQKLHHHLIAIRARHTCTDAVVEVPGSFTYARSAHGQKPLNAAAIAKLNMAIGAVLVSLAGCKVHLVEASKWKGNMGKETAKRLAKVNDDNEADALLLLKWFEVGVRKYANS